MAAAVAKSAKVSDSNMSSESVIKWLKKNDEFVQHCDNLPLYLHYCFSSHVKSDALFASQLSSLQSLIDRNVDRINKKKQKVNHESLTQDAKHLQKEDEIESQWCRKHLHQVDEGKLKRTLKDVFVDTGDCNLAKSYSAQQREIAGYAIKAFQHKFMSYSTYNQWMTGARTTKNPLQSCHISVIQSYIDQSNLNREDKLKRLFENEHLNVIDEGGNIVVSGPLTKTRNDSQLWYELSDATPVGNRRDIKVCHSAKFVKHSVLILGYSGEHCGDSRQEM